MCEVDRCKCQGKFWIQRNSMNLITCGRHLPGTVRSFRDADHQTAHESYKLTQTSSVIVKVRYPHPVHIKESVWR